MAEQIAGYEVLSELGRGASSTIYAVMDPRDQHVYALKRVVLKTSSDQRFFDQAVSEHEIAQQIDHPVIRKSYKVIRKRKVIRTSELIVLMELVDGSTVEQHRPESIRAIARVFVAVAAGLSAMHKAGFVHCDIKPNNIIVNPDGVVKVIDLGQACPANTVKKRIQGTPDYIAPEQVLRQTITPQTDIFNLGATMYWCLTNRHVPTLIPKSQTEIGLRTDIELKPPSEFRSDVPKALDTLLTNCLQTEPRDRPHHMDEVRRRLELVVHQLSRRSKAEAKRTA